VSGERQTRRSVRRRGVRSANGSRSMSTTSARFAKTRSWRGRPQCHETYWWSTDSIRKGSGEEASAEALVKPDAAQARRPHGFRPDRYSATFRAVPVRYFRNRKFSSACSRRERFTDDRRMRIARLRSADTGTSKLTAHAVRTSFSLAVRLVASSLET